MFALWITPSPEARLFGHYWKCAFLRIKPPLRQKRLYLLNHLPITHHERVRHRQDQMILHAVDFGSFHGDLAVIGAGQHGGKEEVDGVAAGDDAQGEIHRAELVGDAIGAGAHLAAGGAVEPLERGPVAQAVHHFAALVGRAEHDGATQSIDAVLAQVLAQQDAPHGMGDEMDGAGCGAFCQCFGQGFCGESLDVFFGGGIALVHHRVASVLQGVCHFLHGVGSAGQTMEQDDALGVLNVDCCPLSIRQGCSPSPHPLGPQRRGA